MFFSDLHSLAKFCNFSAMLEYMLRDDLCVRSIIFRFSRGNLPRGHSHLQIYNGLEIVQGLETEAKNMRELTKCACHEVSQATVQEVHRVSPLRSQRSSAGSSSKTTIKCFCCGIIGHTRLDCHFRELACHK